MWADGTAYLASLKVQKSTASTGDGLVKMTWLDITGKPFMNPLGVGPGGVNATNPVPETGYAVYTQMIGATMVAIEGMEQPVEIGGEGSQIYMTSFVYFHPEAQPANGSYFVDWTFNGDDAAYITRMADPMGHVAYTSDWSEEQQAWVDIIDSANSVLPLRSPCFKVLPDKDHNAALPVSNPSTPEEIAEALAFQAMLNTVTTNPNNLYAVFNKYLLGNPVATSANVEAEENATANLTVTVEVDGDAASLDAEDFAAFTFTNNSNSEWSYDLAAALASKEVVSAQKTRIVIPITYTYKGDGYGTKNSTFTISMAGETPSTLNVNLSVVALDPSRPEALLLDGKDDASPASGTLSAMLAADISSYTNPIIKLNKQHADAITLPSKNFTFDLNGNEAGAITVAGGNITIAYSSFGGSAASLTVNGGKAILNGGTFGSLTIGTNGTVEQNGATITGAATNEGTLTTTEGVFESGLTSSKTLTLNGGSFAGENAVIVSGGTANINRGTLNGTTLGLKVTGGTATVKKQAAINSEGSYSAQRTGGTLNVECGKFGKPLNGTINFTSGYFVNQSYGVATEGKTEMLISAGVEYNEGYRYFLGTTESAQTNGVGVCRIGSVSYSKLEDAIAYANNNPSVANIVIFMTNNYTLPAGYYTLPANATIVVPMSDTQEKEINLTAPRVVFNDVLSETPYTSIMPTEFRRLTFASGVNLDVFGQIELTCSQYASNEAYTSQPVGPYGRLVMEEGSHMTLQNGAVVRAWGFMTGKGETDARRGSTVREMFQLGDWKGAMTSVAITGLVNGEDNPTLCNIVKSQGGVDDCDYSDKKIFPVTQYFIQNVESPIKYHPGAVLSTSAAVSEGLLGMSVSMAANDVAIVGVNDVHEAIFLMDQMADADNTWVRKWYDTENDVQVYEINSAAHIGSMLLDMGDINLLTYGSVPIRLNSANFDLPLTCNFKIHLLSGSMDFQQNTSLLPGAEVEVDKEAMVTVAKDESDPDHTGALYVYDAQEWGKYAYCNEYDGSSLVKDKAYTKVVRYAPSWNGRPTKRNEQTCPPDAAINVRGTFMTATGFVYTSESGANIFSNNEDAGTFIFNDDALAAGTREVWNVEGVKTYQSLTFYPARLKHGDGTYENTDEAVADLAYCYQNDKWSTMIQDECFMKENRGGNDVYYAKPQEYVALANGKTANADHTYSDAAGAGRLFILIQNGYNCQWWEVENVDNLYHCTHPQNDTYYYWDEDEEAWKEKTYTITWKNWDGSIIQTIGPSETLEDEYIVTYGTMAEFLGPNPTRENNIDSTYSFTGWKPALGPVTQDVTYTATYESQPRMYTIIFNNEGGTEIERQFLEHNAVPVCENTPTKVGHILQWDPAISPVIGDQTYTATWLEELPTAWDVTFVNNAGGVLKDTYKVGVAEHPSYSGTPVKENADHSAYSSNEYTYTFWGWSAVIDGVAQRFAAGTELPCPTHATTYTAVYTEARKTYTVIFQNEDESEIERHEYAYGETPVCSATPTKENTAEYTYSFAWTPQIQTVMGAATYRATFPATKNKYTVTLTSNLSGVCTFTGAGTFDYGTTINSVSVSYNSEKYTFNGWSDLAAEDENKKNSTHPSFTLTGDVTLTANFTPIALSDHTVTAEQTWDVPADTEIKDLIITSDGAACGQLLNPANLTIRGEAIYRIQQTFAAGTWYAVAVPWRVNPATGIYGASGRLASGSQIYIIEFDGAAYANADIDGEGKTTDTYQYWHFLHETGGDMVPGKLYMIWLTSGQSKLDFYKKAGAALQTRNLTVSTASGSAGASFGNWNAISNPALYTADLSTGVTKYQTYDNNVDESYTLVDAATEDLIVAKPIFVQVTTPGTVYATVSSGSAPAPYRTAPLVENESKFVVEISRNNKMADRLIIETADEKADEYVIGQDLAKFGVSSKVAQMWVDRYDAKLCVNVVEMENERAEYPLSIFVPAEGEYTLSAAQRRGEMALYLTYNGEAIANLSESAYTLTLNRGTAFGYGLRISPKMPQVTTGVDELIINSKDATATKVLINNKVYIIRGEKVYTVDGQLVK